MPPRQSRRSPRPSRTARSWPVFDHLVRRAGLASQVRPGTLRVDPFGGGEPWLVTGFALEALEPLVRPNAFLLWLEGRAADLLELEPRALLRPRRGPLPLGFVAATSS